MNKITAVILLVLCGCAATTTPTPQTPRMERAHGWVAVAGDVTRNYTIGYEDTDSGIIIYRYESDGPRGGYLDGRGDAIAMAMYLITAANAAESE